MHRYWLAGAYAVAIGCGGDEVGPGLTGDWLYIADNGYQCATGLTLEDDGTFVMSDFCELEGGGVGAQIFAGSYNEAGDELVFDVKRSSCPGAQRATQRMTFELGRDTLTLGTASNVLVLERLAGGDNGMTGGVAITAGCWADDGTFAASPVREL